MAKIVFKIDQILQSQEKTVYWLSKQANISYNNLSKIVNNETNSIRFDKLIDIMNALNIDDISEIMEFKHYK